MTWFKVDDSFHCHAKLADLESGPRFAEAIALWTVAGSWCADQLQDGFVPVAQLRKLVPFNATKAASELVRVGFWDAVEGGYQFHDWHEYQPTKERVEAERAANAGRLAKWREKNRKRDASVTASVTPHVTALQTLPSETVTPSRPVPSRSLPTEESAARSAPLTLAVVTDEKPNRKPRKRTDYSEQDSAIDAFEFAWSSRHGSPLGIAKSKADRDRAASVLRWAKGVDATDPLRVIRETASRAIADSWVGNAAMPWAAFAKSPGSHYATASKPKPTTPGTKVQGWCDPVAHDHMDERAKNQTLPAWLDGVREESTYGRP